MADGESDLETDRLELDLETLYIYSNDNCSVQSKEYCSEFCKLVEEHTEKWHLPLPQLKVLRTALTGFTRATSSYPDDCQHVCYTLSSLALSFFELMLFFGKEEFQEPPLKDILATFQACHRRLLRHRNIHLMQVRQVIKDGGPWERPTLQAILKGTGVTQTEMEKYLSSEKPVFFELRIRYLQACQRVQEAIALAKSCLKHPVVGKHLFFQQAYLTCLYKTSLHTHLHKEIAEIDARDAVEIICNTESQEKDELILSLCKDFLIQQLHNGDMYYIWDLVFLWSRLYFRAHPSKQGFLSECRQLMLSAINARAIFPFIKVITAEMGYEGVPLCLEICATALQTDSQPDPVTCCLLWKTIAFLLPGDLEVCRLCALLVFCLERSVEAYKTVYLLYTHPDEEPHPHHSLVKTNIRFYILQVLKEGLFFDPEFWNLLTLRTHCLELITDKAMRDSLNELREEEELEEVEEEWIPSYWMEEESCRIQIDTPQLHLHANTAPESFEVIGQEPEGGEDGDIPVRRRRKKRRWRRRMCMSDVDYAEDPEVRYPVKNNHSSESPSKLPANRQREYLSRHVKNKILKRRGRKPRWLLLEMTRQTENLSQRGTKVSEGMRLRGAGVADAREGAEDVSEKDGKGSGGLQKREHKKEDKKERQVRQGKRPYRRTIPSMELSFPENEVHVEQEVLENDLEPRVSFKPQHRELAKYVNMGHPNGVYAERPYKYKPDTIVQPSVAEPSVAKCLDVEPPVLKLLGVKPSEPIDGKHLVFKCPGLDPVEVETSDSQPSDSQVLQGPSIQTDPELDGPAFEMEECPLKMFHIYSKNSKGTDANELPLTEGDVTAVEVEMEPNTQGEDTPPDKAPVDFKHLRFHCSHCQKLYKGGNVVRHTLAHLKLRQTRLSCVFCAKQFRRYNHAKEHVLEHIEELRTSILSSKIKPAVNGDSKPSQDVGQPSEKETKPRDGVTDPKVVKAKPVVSKQTRILQNLRTLIKKTQNLKCKKDSDNQPSSEVKEEQVTVKDKVVIVRDLETDTDNRGGEEVEGKQKQYHLCPAEGCASVFARIGPSLLKHAANYHMDDSAVLEKTFQWGKGKCLICQRCFLVLEHYRDHMKVHNAPLKQACLHLNCGQRFKTLQELKDHVDTHQPLQAPCGYAGCEKVFFNILSLHDHEWRHYTQPQAKEELIAPRALRPGDEALWKCRTKSLDMAEQGWRGQTETHSLKTRHLNPYERCFHCNRYLWNHQHFFDHIKIHDAPLKQMCLHLDCGQRFSTPHLLREHMDTHRPLRALCGYSGCGLTFSYLPSLQEHEWKHYSDHKLTEVLSSTKEEQTAEFDTNGIDSPVETSGPVHVVATTTPSLHPIIKILNGCDGEDNKNVSPEAAFAAATTTSQVTTNAVPLPRIPSIIKETVNMREVEDVTLAQVILGGKEPVIVEHKTFKPEDPLYLSMAKAPLARPPPSSYLSEEALSMRKRGNSEEAPVGVLAKKTKIAVKKVLGKKIVTEEVVVKVEPPPPKRQRCSKCFSSFMSPEDLEKHLSQNTCSSLFSFDSDDDS